MRTFRPFNVYGMVLLGSIDRTLYWRVEISSSLTVVCCEGGEVGIERMCQEYPAYHRELRSRGNALCLWRGPVDINHFLI